MDNQSTLQQNKIHIPRLRRYTNILTFLGDYFNYRKSEDDNFSYEQWSKELGFGSATFMYLVCSGKRSFTVDTATKIIPFLNLDELEKKHILLLANYSQIRSAEVRSALFDKIIENIELPELRLVAKEYKDFITSTTMPLVRMILSYDDFSGTENEILDLLDISNKQLKLDLAVLERMGLIKKLYTERSKDFVWKSIAKAIKIPDMATNDILDFVHEGNLKESLLLVRQQHIYKKFRSLAVTVSPDEYEILENEIEQFATRLKNRFYVNDLSGKHLLKLSLQAYQVSKIKPK